MKKILTLLLAFMIVFGSPLRAHIRILNPWVRATNGPHTALYMEIQNTSNKPDKLVKVHTHDALYTSLHNHMDVGNGTLHMSVVDSIVIPAGGTKYLIPGGYHVMLQNISHSLQVGKNIVQLLAEFESGEVVPVTAPVKAVGPMPE